MKIFHIVVFGLFVNKTKYENFSNISPENHCLEAIQCCLISAKPGLFLFIFVLS